MVEHMMVTFLDQWDHTCAKTWRMVIKHNKPVWSRSPYIGFPNRVLKHAEIVIRQHASIFSYNLLLAPTGISRTRRHPHHIILHTVQAKRRSTVAPTWTWVDSGKASPSKYMIGWVASVWRASVSVNLLTYSGIHRLQHSTISPPSRFSSGWNLNTFYPSLLYYFQAAVLYMRPGDTFLENASFSNSAIQWKRIR